MENLKQWATFYAGKGLAVFPLSPRDKKPATADGSKEATTDITKIEFWWTDNPDYNIGIATGTASGGLTVISMDDNGKEDIKGCLIIADFQVGNGEFPETWERTTINGGYSLFYRGSKVFDNVPSLYDCVDIYGEESYIIAPPSIGPSGNACKWRMDPEKIPLANVNNSISVFLEGPEKNGFKIPEENVSEDDETTPKYKTTTENGIIVPLKHDLPKFAEAVDSAAYQNIEFPPLHWMIEGILTDRGLAGIYAKPKVGKTWFCYELAFAVATGGDFLGTKEREGTVIYYDLETTPRNRKERLKKMAGGKPIPSGIKFISEVGTIGNGFEEDMAYRLKKWPDTRLVIIDTIKKIRTPIPSNLTENQHDDNEIGKLAKFINGNDILMLAVNHNKKATEEDPFDSALGSVSIIGSLDSVLVFTQSRGDDGEITGTTLHVKGREVEESHYRMGFDDCHWSISGKATDYDETAARDEFMSDSITRAALSILEDSEGYEWKGSAKDFKNDAARFGINLSSMSSQGLTKKIKLLETGFIIYCGIEHEEIKHKQNSTIYHFYNRNFGVEGFKAM